MMRHGPVGLLVLGLALVGASCSDADSEPETAPITGGSSGSGGAAIAGFGGTSGGGAGGTTAGGGTSGSGGMGTGGMGPMRTKTFVYVATGDWGNAGAGRVRAYTLDRATLALGPAGAVESGTLPSYMTFDPAGETLYVGDEEEGVLRAYAVDRTSGALEPIGSSVEAEGHPVYVSVDAGARFLLSAYYNEGGVEVFGIGANRGIGASITAPSTGTQAHSIVIAPDNRHVFVPNKGSNTISQFVLGADGQLAPNTPPNVGAGGGPRHLTFHPSRPLAYVVGELASTVSAHDYDAAQGLLAEIETESTLPAGASGASSGRDIHVEPGGRFLYVSNRDGAASTLAIFAIDANSGSLNLLGHESTRGNTPRNFGIHPDGDVLLVANQDSNSVAAFRLDAGSGALTFVSETDVTDKAWCVRFLVVPDEG